MEKHDEQWAPVWTHGLVGVAAIGIFSLVMMAIIIVGAPAEQFRLTSAETTVSPAQE